VEDGDDRHAVHDLAGEDHLEDFVEGEGTDLDEFSVIWVEFFFPFARGLLDLKGVEAVRQKLTPGPPPRV